MGMDLGDEGLNGSPKSETEESGEEVDLDYQQSQSQPPTIEEIEDMVDELNGRSQPQIQNQKLRLWMLLMRHLEI